MSCYERNFIWPGRSGSPFPSEESWELHSDLEFTGWRLLERAQGSGLRPLIENLTWVSANVSTSNPMYSKLFCLTCTVSRGKTARNWRTHMPNYMLYRGPVPAALRLFPKP